MLNRLGPSFDRNETRLLEQHGHLLSAVAASPIVDCVAGVGGQREAGDETLANRSDDRTPQCFIGFGALCVSVAQHRRLLIRRQASPVHRSAVELLTPSDSTPFPASAHSGSPSLRYRAE